MGAQSVRTTRSERSENAAGFQQADPRHANLQGVAWVHLQDAIFQITIFLEKASKVDTSLLPPLFDLEISHHYGMEYFFAYGAASFWTNGKKILFLVPGQKHPAHHHLERDETYSILFGSAVIDRDGEEVDARTGNNIHIPRGVIHTISTAAGVIIEENFSSLDPADSYYYDDAIPVRGRKTLVRGFSLHANEKAEAARD
jgi:mannose-6-phosphate isomerase-like protein (cupin superfamily)